ncbi:MAG: diguanylate cyclase, partial [Anaerolineales bacterium]|nr:diguanylate cyclase [Anaerolineales bacterium]
IEEAQREILDAYVSARIANLLVEQLKDYDVITQRDRHFIVLLPETDNDKVSEIVDRLKRTAREQLGLEFKIGLSTFPDEAVTFERLLEQAEAKMEQTPVIAERHLELAAASVNGVAH